MGKVAKVKTVIRKNNNGDYITTDVLDENIDQKSINENHIVDELLYVTKNESETSLRSVGGINIGDDISNMSTRDILKKILLPYTKPEGVIYVDSGDIVLSSGNWHPGSEILITNIDIRVNPKSEPVVLVYPIIEISNNPSIIIEKKNVNIKSSELVSFHIENQINGSNIIIPNFITGTVKIKAHIEDSTGGVATYSVITLTVKPSMYYGNSNQVFDVDSDGNIVNDMSQFFNYGNTDWYVSNGTTNALKFNKPNNEYSWFLYPAHDKKKITGAIDQNGFTHTLTYIGKTTCNSNGVIIPYDLYITGTSTMTNTDPTYKFIIS